MGSNGVRAIAVACKCGAVMGNMVQVDGRVYLDTGGWLIAQGKRHCHICGRPFHFTASQAAWEKHMQRQEAEAA